MKAGSLLILFPHKITLCIEFICPKLARETYRIRESNKPPKEVYQTAHSARPCMSPFQGIVPPWWRATTECLLKPVQIKGRPRLLHACKPSPLAGRFVAFILLGSKLLVLQGHHWPCIAHKRQGTGTAKENDGLKRTRRIG